MKALQRYIYLLLCLPLFMAACSDDDPEPTPEPSKGEVKFLSQASVFEAEAGSQEIEFSSTTKWTAYAEQSWCKVQPASGERGKRTLVITVEPNNQSDERNTSVIVKAGSAEKRMTITQKQKNALLLTSSKAEISAEAQDISIEVKANISYDVAIDDKAAEWISPIKSRSLKANTHRFSVLKNESEERREGKIVFKGEGISEVFTVYQQGGETPQLVLTKKEYIVGSQQEVVKIELQSNTDYQMILPEVEWIHEDKSRALSSYTHYLIVDENTLPDMRKAEIQFVYGEQTEKVTISQQQKDAIVLSKNSYEIKAEGEKLDFVVASNVAYEVNISSDWIKNVNDSRGLTKKEESFIIAKNPGTEERSGEIIFKSNSVEQKVTILQKGQVMGELEFLNTLKTFESKGGTQELKISSTLDWTVTSQQTWCEVSSQQGKAGEQVISITVSENTSNDERNAALVFKSGSIEKILTVTQKQKDALLLSSSKAEVKVEGGDVAVEVSSNVVYEINIDAETAEWVTRDLSRTMTTQTYHFKVAKNTTYKQRIGKIEFVANGLTEIFHIYQDAGEEPQLILSQKEYVLDYTKTEFTVELKSNTNYEMIMPEVSWIRENPSRALSDYTHHFIVDENTTDEERTADILFVYANRTETVSVIQNEKGILTLSKDHFDVEAEGDTVSFDVETNVEYTIKVVDEWIKQVEDTRALVNKTLQFTIDANPTERERTGEIIIQCENLEYKVTVTQKGARITNKFVMIHTNKICVLPTFMSKQRISGTVDWGDSSSDAYLPGLTHMYKSDGNHTVTADLKNAQKVRMEDIEGVVEIDLSLF